MKDRFPRLSYANVVATLALFVALGGGAWAATQLPRNSVGAKQLKKNAVVTAKIKKEAVTGAKIRKGTIDGSRLNLASIGTVPSATKAGSATTAGDASTLAGAEAATYLDRVAQATSNTIATGIGAETDTDVTPSASGPLKVTVPAGVGYVVAEATASFASPAGAMGTELWVEPDATCLSSSFGWFNRVFGRLQGTGDVDELVQSLAFPVTPGTHAFRLCARSSSASTLVSRALILTTVARGAGG